MPCTCEIETGSGSAVGLASPLLVRVPLGLIRMIRWLLTVPGAPGSSKTVTWPSRDLGLWSGEARITSPTPIRGSIEPDFTT